MADRVPPQAYLVAIAIGPVQEFIAASRKARDLWAGSDLLSRLCEAAALDVAKRDTNELIFPTADSLEQHHAIANKLLVSTTADPATLVTAVRDAVTRALADEWTEAYEEPGERNGLSVPARLERVWQKGGQKDTRGNDLADRQIAGFIEFNAAWTPYGPEPESYAKARLRVERLLAGRKALREFDAAPILPGRPKSSLDPARESVFTLEHQKRANVRSLLHLNENEFLDAISLLKRFRGASRFPSTSRVALDPFIRSGSCDLATLACMREAAEAVSQTDLAETIAMDATLAHYKVFPYDCQLLYEPSPDAAAEQVVQWLKQAIKGEVRDGRLDVVARWLLEHVGAVEDPSEAAVTKWVLEQCGRDLDYGNDSAKIVARRLLKARDAYPAARRLVESARTLHARIAEDRGEPFGEMPTYYAVLLADGDRMGAALGTLDDKELHKAFSTQLGTFASDAGRIVREHFGVLIYAGGDDVLAFLPLDTALPCADALQREFSEMIDRAEHDIARIKQVDTFTFATADGMNGKTPTLSVGLAIGHYSEHLQAMLDRARGAERKAKERRNSLAVSFGSRSGGGDIRMVAHHWTEEPVQKRWGPAVDGHRHDTFPDGAAYQLEALHAEWQETYLDHAGNLRADLGGLSDAVLADVLRGEVQRILGRKQARGGTDETTAARADEIVARLAAAYRAHGDPPARDHLKQTLAVLRTIVDELIIARRIAPLLADDRPVPEEASPTAFDLWNAHPAADGWPVLQRRRMPVPATAGEGPES